jgi:hypothetical protein
MMCLYMGNFEREQYREPGNDAAILTYHVPIPKSIDQSAEVTMEEQMHGEAGAEVHHQTLFQTFNLYQVTLSIIVFGIGCMPAIFKLCCCVTYKYIYI